MPRDRNGSPDIYLRDLAGGTIKRVSIPASGSPGVAPGYSFDPSISADGKLVAFYSKARLVPEDSDDRADVYVRDVRTRTTWLASGVTSVGDAFNPAVSGDGRLVAFSYSADDLVPGDANGQTDVILARATGASAVIASVSSDGSQGNDRSSYPAVSRSGQFVTFTSEADNLVDGDQNTREDVFVHDRRLGSTVLASVGPAPRCMDVAVR